MRLKKETQYRISHHPYPRTKLGRIKPSGTITKNSQKAYIAARRICDSPSSRGYQTNRETNPEEYWISVESVVRKGEVNVKIITAHSSHPVLLNRISVSICNTIGVTVQPRNVQATFCL
jgi:hypothetical protein